MTVDNPVRYDREGGSGLGPGPYFEVLVTAPAVATVTMSVGDEVSELATRPLPDTDRRLVVVPVVPGAPSAAYVARAADGSEITGPPP